MKKEFTFKLFVNISLFCVIFLITQSMGFAKKDGDDIIIGKYKKIFSKVLKEERTILVHLPEGYEKSKHKYPVKNLRRKKIIIKR